MCHLRRCSRSGGLQSTAKQGDLSRTPRKIPHCIPLGKPLLCQFNLGTCRGLRPCSWSCCTHRSPPAVVFCLVLGGPPKPSPIWGLKEEWLGDGMRSDAVPWHRGGGPTAAGRLPGSIPCRTGDTEPPLPAGCEQLPRCFLEAEKPNLVLTSHSGGSSPSGGF